MKSSFFIYFFSFTFLSFTFLYSIAVALRSLCDRIAFALIRSYLSNYVFTVFCGFLVIFWQFLSEKHVFLMRKVKNKIKIVKIKTFSYQNNAEKRKWNVIFVKMQLI